VALARGLLERAGTLWGSAGQELTVRVGWDELRVSLGGTLLGEDRPAFLAGCERGKEVDIWEAVAIALGEDGYQTVP
jgi:hypothetical protein